MSKPAYRVPPMAEITALEPNGFTAISTFSGSGGSSLGYRMAGFRVAWASEFVAAARDTYRANAAAPTILDPRDIREVEPADVLEQLGLGVGELDLLDGSPPCSSFSTAGIREDSWGKVKAYSDVAQRSDDLFFEYARLLAGVRPRVFVAENVSGLVKGTAKGYFKRILDALRGCGYRVEARLLDASWLGVPQARQRLVFVGVRDDLPAVPVFPKPLPYQYSVRDALPWINEKRPTRVMVVVKKGARSPDLPAPTIQTHGRPFTESELTFSIASQEPDPDRLTRDPETGRDLTISAGSGDGGHIERRRMSLGELRRLGGFPDDFVLTGNYEQRWERIGRAVPPPMMAAIASAIRDQILRPLAEQGAISA